MILKLMVLLFLSQTFFSKGILAALNKVPAEPSNICLGMSELIEMSRGGVSFLEKYAYINQFDDAVRGSLHREFMKPSQSDNIINDLDKLLQHHMGDSLDLGGLTSLSDEAIEILLTKEPLKTNLNLNGISKIEPNMKGIFENSRILSIQLNSLSEIPNLQTVLPLAIFKGHLHLDGLRSLDSPHLKMYLPLFEANALNLGGLEKLSDGDLKILSKAKSHLYFSGIENLDVSMLNVLKQNKKYNVDFSGLTHLRREEAKELISLRHLSFLMSPQSYESLDLRTKALVLDKLKTLDIETAKELASFKGDILSLGGLTEINRNVVEVLLPPQSSEI